MSEIINRLLMHFFGTIFALIFTFRIYLRICFFQGISKIAELRNIQNYEDTCC